MVSCHLCAALRAKNVACRLWCSIPKCGESCTLVDHASVARKAILAEGLHALGAPEEHPSSCSGLAAAMGALVMAAPPLWAEVLRMDGGTREAHRNGTVVAHHKFATVPARLAQVVVLNLHTATVITPDGRLGGSHVFCQVDEQACIAAEICRVLLDSAPGWDEASMLGGVLARGGRPLCTMRKANVGAIAWCR